MKTNLILILLCCFGIATYAQEVKSDSTKRDSTKQVKKSFKLTIGGRDTVKAKSNKPSSKFSVQLTMARMDLGLAKFIDNGSFTLSPENQLLENHTWKTHNIGFEFFQMGYRFNSYIKAYIGGGIDWTHMRLKKDITIQPDKPSLTIFEEPDMNFKKNRFSSTYLRLPLSFQFRTKDDRKGNKVHFVFGPEVGFLVNGKTKQISDEGKRKVKDDFNLNPLRYGGFARLGYGSFGLFIKHYNSDVFADNQGGEGIKNTNFGIMLGW
jgi:hypothetical protein